MSEPIIVRTNEGAEAKISMAWDTTWRPYDPNTGLGAYGDWAIADPEEEPRNAGGFSNKDQLATSIGLCLFTNLRRPDWMDIGDARREGWAGDTFDLDADAGERPAGSWLWTLRNGELTEATRQKAIVYATEALQTLLIQGAVASFDITCEIDSIRGYMKLGVHAFAGTGESIYSNEFPLR